MVWIYPWVLPFPTSSQHQDDYMFTTGFRTKSWFATTTGKGAKHGQTKNIIAWNMWKNVAKISVTLTANSGERKVTRLQFFKWVKTSLVTPKSGEAPGDVMKEDCFCIFIYLYIYIYIV